MAVTPDPQTGLSSLSINRPIGTLALTAVVLVLGLFFTNRLPVDLLPQVVQPNIRVTVNYPGVAPEVMEQQVTRVLERHLAATENLAGIDSRASQGRTNVNLRFELGTNLDLALQDAARNLELARTQLPPDIEPPRLYKFDPAQDPVWQAGFSSSLRSEAEIRDWIDHELTPQLITLPGVSGVEATGGQVREIQVTADPHRLNHYGLTLDQLADILATENVEQAAGWLTSDTLDVMTKTEGLYQSLEELDNLMIPLPSGQQLPLHQLAEVADSHQEQRLFARLNGQNAIQVSIYKLPDANTVEVVDRINATLKQLKASGFIDPDLNFQPTTDPTFFIRGSLTSVGTAALLGGLLAMLMVLLFLGSLRKALVISLALPLAILATFALMGVTGLTLNIISLGGLALGVGLLLDNSIVMLENLERHRRLGKTPQEAAHAGSREVVSAITAGTLTNLAAVLPFLLITGLASLIFRDLILTLSFALLTTLVAAVTLVPTLATLLAGIRFTSGLQTTRLIQGFQSLIQTLTQLYQRSLPRLLAWRWPVLFLTLVIFIISIHAFNNLGQTFLPQVDDGQVSVHLRLEPGSPPETTSRYAHKVEEILLDDPQVVSLFSLIGGHLGGGTLNERPGTARFSVQLTPASQRPDMSAGRWVSQMQARLEELELPRDSRIQVRPPSIPGLRLTARGDDFSVGVLGQDLGRLQQHAQEITAALQGIPGLEGVEIGRDDETPLLRVQVDRQKAASLGLQVSEVGRALRQALEGEVPTRFVTPNQDYDLRLKLPSQLYSNPEELGELLLFRHQGSPVYLQDVASFELGQGPAHIERENQSRIVRVNGDINTQVADVASIMAEVEKRLEQINTPENISLIFAGQWETLQQTRQEAFRIILLALFLVLVVLAVQYERISNPLVILTAAPLSLVGVVALLSLTNTPLSAPAMIGLVLLVGLVVNNSILLLEYVEQARKRGLALEAALIEACGLRLRPILMTTSTTLLGILPLALGWGEGAEIMQPLALTLIGGLLVSLFLTLMILPCLYWTAEQFIQVLKRKLMQEPSL